MRLECEADKRAWADVVDVWTRGMVKEFYDILGQPNATEALRDYYREVVKDAAFCDVEGKEYHGLDEIFALDDGDGLDNVDAAVVNFWATLPQQAYTARQKLGNAIRGD